MLEKNIEKVKNYFDWGAIVVGVSAMVCWFVWPHKVVACDFLKFLSALLGAVYSLYAILLWFGRRIEFDWRLVHGHFLRKVVCLVLLIPFIITTIVSIVFGSSADIIQQLVSNVDISDPAQHPSLFWSVYYHYIDPGNQHMTALPAGRGVAALVGILGVFLLNGLLVSSIIGWIDKRKENWQSGDFRYRSVGHFGKGKFAVVFGANEIAAVVIKNLFSERNEGEINFKCEGKNEYVILQTRRDVAQVRMELSSHLNEDEMRRVVIYNALRDSIDEMDYLYLQHSTEIYVLGESTLADGGETYHDALNMRCVNLMAQNLEKSRRERERAGQSVRKVCKVMFEYQTTSSVFQFSDISATVQNNLIFIPFNRYESWARKVLIDGVCRNEESLVEYMPLDGDGICGDSEEFVHLVIVGMSKMGISMGVQALLHAHYLNSRKARTRITFIDTNADKEMAFFKGHYDNLFELVRTRYIDASTSETNSLGESKPGAVKSDYNMVWDDPMEREDCKWRHLSNNGKNFLDVEIEFIKGAVESEGVRECLKTISQNPDAKLTIAVCLTSTHQAVAASLYMPMEVYRNTRLQQIWVYQLEAADIVQNLNNVGRSDLRYSKLKPFGMLYGEYMSDRTLYLKALLVNVAYDITNNYGKEGCYDKVEWPESISDKSDPNFAKARKSWNELSVDKKWSNKYFADSIYIKIRNIMIGQRYFSNRYLMSYLLGNRSGQALEILGAAFKANEEALAICEHNRWNIQQLILGYSPCDEELDKVFELRDIHGKKSEMVKKEYVQWKQKALNIVTDINKLGDIKDDVKACELRIHPNLCDYSHLDKIDSGAKKYDKDMNNSILNIITIVDGYRAKYRG